MRLSDFTLDGNIGGQGLFRNQGNGGNIVLGHVRDCIIERVESKNANGQCIQVAATLPDVSERVSIRDCLCEYSSGSTLNADGSVAAEFNGNGIGIQVSQCYQLIIRDNFIRGMKDNGIDVFGNNAGQQASGGSIVIRGNNIANCRNGIFPETTAFCLVDGNYINGMLDAGIAINRIVSAPAGIRVCNNMIGQAVVGVSVTGDCSAENGVVIENNTIYNLLSAAGFGVRLGGEGGNVSYVLVASNCFAVGLATIPLIGVLGDQAAFIRILDNRFFGSPAPGYRAYRPATTQVEVLEGGWIGIGDPSGTDLERRDARFERAAVTALPIAADEAAAASAGILLGELYRDVGGVVRVRTTA